MAVTRQQVDDFFIALGRHIISIDQAPGTTPEYKATLDTLKTALWEHIDITREIIPLQSSEQNPNEKNALSVALTKSAQTDNMIVNFIKNYCDEYQHPGALVNRRMETVSVTANISASTRILKAILNEYKKRGDRL